MFRNNIKYFIAILISVSFLFGCKNNESPSLTNAIKVISGNAINAKSYNVPEGIFRGVLWPTPNESVFTIWIIRDKKELYFKVAAPPEIANWKNKVTDQWEVEVIKDVDTTLTFSAKRTGKNVSVEFELPKKKRDYSFTVLENGRGTQSIVFMDISQDISGLGLFGYIVIES